MFGSKKNKQNEQIKDILDLINQQRLDFESSVDEVEEERKRIYSDFCQLAKNTDELSVHANLNIEEASAAIHGIDESSKDWNRAFEDYRQLEEKVQEQLQAAVTLVESNKHFTSPAKQLSEASKAISKGVKNYEKQLDDAIKNGISMEALAIMKDEAAATQARVNELEETVSRLISLMKDNNVGTTKLLMKCQETENFMKQSCMRDFSGDLISIRDKTVNIRNLEEEIAKCLERNKIQLSDIQEDMKNQKKKLAEMESDLFYILDSAEEKVCKAHRG